MVRKRSLSPAAIRLAALLPFISLGAVACGGSDYLPGGAEDAEADSAPFEEASVGSDGAANDAGADAASADATMGEDAASGEDGSDGSRDASDRDASRPSDASREDASDSSGGSDASQGTPDASEGTDATSGGPDASDASRDASDASDARDATDADAMDASDASDASDAEVDGGVMNILGQATNFAVFGTATVTNAGLTTIDGDLGSASSTAIGTTNPTVVPPFGQHLGDSAATAALADIKIAYNELIPGNLPGCALLPADVGGMTITPGIYCFSSTAAITGILTLDAQSNPNAVWVFQVGSALTVNVGSSIVIKPGTGAAGQVCNSYWQVTSAATIGTGSVFGGNILANAAVSLGTGVTVLGRAFSWSGGVTMLSNTVGITGCAAIAPVP